MSGEKPGMRGAIDRVAVRIHEQAQKTGQPSTFESARKQARAKAISYDNRNPAKTRADKGSKPRG